MAVAATFALVIMMSGWAGDVDKGTAASRGNAIDHITGFTSEAKCKKAGELIVNASYVPKVMKTVCVESSELVDLPTGAGGYVLAIVINGWTNDGGGSDGNAVSHVRGIADTKRCEAAAAKVRDTGFNNETTRTACLEL